MPRAKPWVWLQLILGWLPVWALYATLIVSAHRETLPFNAAWVALRAVGAAAVLGLLVHRFTERRLIQAYLKLFLAAQGEDGAKTVCLARFGSHEVRVIELWHDASASGFPVWLELYEHDTHSTLDSCGCSELEEAVAAADELIAQARQLCRLTTQA